MNFEILENEVANRLSLKIVHPNIRVFKMPEYDADDQSAFPFAQRWLIVAVSEEKTDEDSLDIGAVSQESSVTLTVLIKAKDLYGPEGVYELHKMLKKALIGFKPSDGDKLKYSSFKFLDRDRGVFQYMVHFKTKAMNMEDVEEEPSGPAFEGLIFQQT